MQQQFLKRWIIMLCLLLIACLIPALLNVEWQKALLYFNFSAFFIAFIFWAIIFLAEKQTPQKKMGYILGGIGIKFILTIVAVVAYFIVFKEKSTPEILITFIINSLYYFTGYYFLYKLSKI